MISHDIRPRLAVSYWPLYDDRPFQRHGGRYRGAVPRHGQRRGLHRLDPPRHGALHEDAPQPGPRPRGVISEESFALFTRPAIPAPSFGEGAGYGYGIAIQPVEGQARSCATRAAWSPSARPCRSISTRRVRGLRLGQRLARGLPAERRRRLCPGGAAGGARGPPFPGAGIRRSLQGTQRGRLRGHLHRARRARARPPDCRGGRAPGARPQGGAHRPRADRAGQLLGSRSGPSRSIPSASSGTGTRWWRSATAATGTRGSATRDRAPSRPRPSAAPTPAITATRIPGWGAARDSEERPPLARRRPAPAARGRASSASARRSTSPTASSSRRSSTAGRSAHTFRGPNSGGSRPDAFRAAAKLSEPLRSFQNDFLAFRVTAKLSERLRAVRSRSQILGTAREGSQSPGRFRSGSRIFGMAAESWERLGKVRSRSVALGAAAKPSERLRRARSFCGRFGPASGRKGRGRFGSNAPGRQATWQSQEQAPGRCRALWNPWRSSS